MELQNSPKYDPLDMLEQLRTRNDSRKCRAFAVACCRRIWKHLTEKLRSAVVIADRDSEGIEDALLARTADEVKRQCFYVDGDSSAVDRLQGFAAEAVLCSLFRDHDYPPIQTYATTCAIAAARAVQEVVYADCELHGGSPELCEQTLEVERRWQCELIQQMFDTGPPRQMLE